MLAFILYKPNKPILFVLGILSCSLRQLDLTEILLGWQTDPGIGLGKLRRKCDFPMHVNCIPSFSSTRTITYFGKYLT